MINDHQPSDETMQRIMRDTGAVAVIVIAFGGGAPTFTHVGRNRSASHAVENMAEYLEGKLCKVATPVALIG